MSQSAQYFSYSDSPYAIREELKTAHRSYWQALASPGSWFDGEQRIAIAAEVRQALNCSFCRQRKQALSPYGQQGQHDSAATVLEPAAVDAVHRIITDQSRITQQYIDDNSNLGLSPEAYVELTSIAVTVFSIDEFHRGLGLPKEPLPLPVAGSPNHYRPPGVVHDTGFVPMLPRGAASGAEADLWPAAMCPNVIRALSLVPDALRQWRAVGDAQYMPMASMANFNQLDNRAIDRAQIELVAGRVSAINECFY